MSWNRLLEDRVEQRRVGGGIMERLAGRIERRDAAFRDQEAHRAVHLVEPAGDPIAHARVFFSAVVRISVTCRIVLDEDCGSR